jgi:UPF0042 nucleotide-binding protein
MRTIIVTGLSGAGKSQAIQILEDSGFFCVDNVPPKLVRTFVDLCRSGDSEIDNLALVTDIRGDIFNEGFQKTLSALKHDNEGVEIMFLEADPDTLINRYQTTRRKHPLTERAGSLSQSIKMEGERLAPLREEADYIINTTGMSPSELRVTVGKILKTAKENVMTQVNVSSFGFKYGMPLSADFVFDVRFLPNPFYKKELRDKTGENQEVRDYVMSFAEARDFLDRVVSLIDSVLPQYRGVGKEHIEVAFGCTGGQHRSVTFAWLFRKAFSDRGFITTINHRDMEKSREL